MSDDISDHLKGSAIPTPGTQLGEMLERRLREVETGAAAWSQARADERSRLIHERDRLQDDLAQLRAKLADATMTNRHRHTLTCDRCSRSLTIASSLALNDKAGGALFQAATWEGWSLSAETSESLGMVSGKPETCDLCAECAKLVR